MFGQIDIRQSSQFWWLDYSTPENPLSSVSTDALGHALRSALSQTALWNLLRRKFNMFDDWTMRHRKILSLLFRITHSDTRIDDDYRFTYSCVMKLYTVTLIQILIIFSHFPLISPVVIHLNRLFLFPSVTAVNMLSLLELYRFETICLPASLNVNRSTLSKVAYGKSTYPNF